jgi:hypothetical protein
MVFSENLSDSALQNVVQICLFLKTMLENVTSIEGFTSPDNEEITTLCLGILQMLLSGMQNFTKLFILLWLIVSLFI